MSFMGYQCFDKTNPFQKGTELYGVAAAKGLVAFSGLPGPPRE